mgnify:CR=1 FL=1
MGRFAPTLILAVVLSTTPAVASGEPSGELTFGEPSGEFAFIQTLSIIFEGQCVADVVKGRVQRLPCEIRAQREGRLWPQELYYLIMFTPNREVQGISTFSVEGESVFFLPYEK